MPFVAPRLIVETQIAEGGGVITTLEGSPTPYSSVLAPAGLYDIQSQKIESYQLHKLLHWTNDKLVFKTYGQPLPATSLDGLEFVFRPWWTDEAWKLVTDKELSWERLPYPSNGSHEHCAITWEAIGQGEKNKEGYRSGDAWVTVQAYEQFIRQDIYHCRDEG